MVKLPVGVDFDVIYNSETKMFDPAPTKPTPAVRAILDQIDDVLVRGDGDAQDLWNILTALRGPDKDADKDLKYGTTVQVRQAAFPKLAALGRAHSSVNEANKSYWTGLGAYVATDAEPMFPSPSVIEHFFTHYRRAMRALGFKIPGNY